MFDFILLYRNWESLRNGIDKGIRFGIAKILMIPNPTDNPYYCMETDTMFKDMLV